MPAKSEAQRRWAYGVKGEKWAEKHHFDNPGDLPAKARALRRKKRRKFSQAAAIQGALS